MSTPATAITRRETRIARLEAELAAGMADLNGVDPAGPTRAGARALLALLASTIEDERRDYDGDRARERAFAKALARLAGPDGGALTPAVRTRKLRELAQALDEGWDGPPELEDALLP